MRWLIKQFRRLGRKIKGYSKSGQILIFVGLFLCTLVSYVFVSLIFISQVDIRLASLRSSYHKEIICRSNCLSGRRQNREAIIEFLRLNPNSRLSRRIERYFLDEDEPHDFRSELALICKEALGSSNPPDFIIVYFNSSQPDPDLVARLLALFSPDVLVDNKHQINGPLDYYFSLLNSPQEMAVYEAALRGISAYPDKYSGFLSEHISQIKDLVIDKNTDIRLRPLLVMLLGDYYPIWPDESSEALRLIYGASSSDEISRAFSADLLNRFEVDGGPDGGKWPLPEISAEDWNKYYER